MARPAAAKSAAKPRKGKLKLFRTEAGFHDAYVAATSRKAALEAWGASTDLFSAGAAAEVDDPRLLREMAERPGDVVRRARGSAAEHVRALGEGKGRRPGRKAAEGRIASPRSPAASRPLPRERVKRRRPSRATVERAEAAVARAEAARERELAAIAREEEALAKRRRAAEARGDKAVAAAERKRDAAREEYRAKLAAWTDSEPVW